MRFRFLFVVLLSLTPATSVWAQSDERVPTPLSHFGFVPGSDRELADWHDLLSYYDRVAAVSPRVSIDTLGSSTRGLPLVMLTITSPENHAGLDSIRDVHLRLADPRRITGSAELERLEREARVIVLLTSHIHSTEVGAGQMPANLLYRLATSTDPEVAGILENVVLLIVPSLNPDGTQMIAEWYHEHLGTPFEGVDPVELYHPYVGHDNNRDWYALTQAETRLVVEKAHNRWRPMIVHDVHQMDDIGPRMFVPPYVEPFERNVDPLLITAINQLGSYMAAELALRGLEGVSTSTQFDLYTPARAYSHYHGGVRILSETASSRLASPLRFDAYSSVGSPVGSSRMNAPLPWSGGEWGLADVVRYQEEGALALLTNAARNRSFWVANFHAVNRRAVDGWGSWPAFWIIPEPDRDRTGIGALLAVLTLGSVEVHRALRSFVADGRIFAAGTYVIPMKQPYAAWAQTLLEIQDYPDVRAYPGGPPARPYDVTAHTLPLLMGVATYSADDIGQTPLSKPIERVDPSFTPPAWLTGARRPRIGLYRGSRESIAAGWTRWLFDSHGVEYTSLSDTAVREGGLERDYDVIVLQDQPLIQIRNGWRVGQVPPRYSGGVGPAGMEALRRFVVGGGRLVAIESATDLAIELFSLMVTNRVADLPIADFYIPGSILRLDVDPSSRMSAGVRRPTSAWFWRTSRAFDVSHPAANVVARYGAEPRQSGWVTGAEHVAGRAAIVEMRVGRGSVVLFGFQPNYRGHSTATWPLLFNALR